MRLIDADQLLVKLVNLQVEVTPESELDRVGEIMKNTVGYVIRMVVESPTCWESTNEVD